MTGALRLWGLLAAGCAAGAGERGPEARHVGPVTAAVRLGDEVLTCSQAGILRERAGRTAVFCRPGFRVLDLAVCVRDKGSLVLVGGGEPALRGVVTVLGQDGATVASAEVARDLVYAVAVAPDGRHGAAALADGRVLEFALPSLAAVQTLHAHTAPARDVAYSPDGRWLASAGLDRVVQLRDRQSGTARALLDHTAGVECLAFAEDGSVLASGARDGKIRCHAAGGRLLRTCQGLGAAVVAVAWHRQERRFFGALADGAVVRLLAEDDGHERVADPAPILARYTAALLPPP